MMIVDYKDFRDASFIDMLSGQEPLTVINQCDAVFSIGVALGVEKLFDLLHQYLNIKPLPRHFTETRYLFDQYFVEDISLRQ
jgi:hypothetical protein